MVVTRSLLSQVVNNSKMKDFKQQATNYRNHTIVFIQRHPCLTLMCISSVLSCAVTMFMQMYPLSTKTVGDMTAQEARIIPGVKDIPACMEKHADKGKIWPTMKVREAIVCPNKIISPLESS